MTTTSLKEILSEFQANTEFREAFKKNAVQACQEFGYEVSPEDMAKLKSTLDLKQGDANQNEELEKRKAP